MKQSQIGFIIFTARNSIFNEVQTYTSITVKYSREACVRWPILIEEPALTIDDQANPGVPVQLHLLGPFKILLFRILIAF